MEYFFLLFVAAQAFMSYRFMYKDKSLKQKMLCSAVFLLGGLYLFIVGGKWDSAFACLITAGLAAGFAGDFSLQYDAFGVKGLPGIVCFALAHILYISAFCVKAPLNVKTLFLLIPWIILIACEVYIARDMKIDFAKAGAAVLCYAGIINAMTLLGIRLGAQLAADGHVLKALVLITGVVMFMLSDGGVCMQMFGGRDTFFLGGKKFSLDNFSILSYFGAQMLIAASILI